MIGFIFVFNRPQKGCTTRHSNLYIVFEEECFKATVLYLHCMIMFRMFDKKVLLLRIRHYMSSDFGSTQISAVNEYLLRVYCILSNSEGTA